MIIMIADRYNCDHNYNLMIHLQNYYHNNYCFRNLKRRHQSQPYAASPHPKRFHPHEPYLQKICKLTIKTNTIIGNHGGAR